MPRNRQLKRGASPEIMPCNCQFPRIVSHNYPLKRDLSAALLYSYLVMP
jgi:hypothetical protein